jgi:CheY-like chemotaxis protein/HPt (histidine-containing phosphotransfer) domain-containing protein
MTVKVRSEFDVYALAKDIQQTLNHERAGTAPVHVSVSPFLPRYFQGNFDAIQKIALALVGAVIRNDSPGTLTLVPARAVNNGSFVVRILAMSSSGSAPSTEDAQHARQVTQWLAERQNGKVIGGLDADDRSMMSVEFPLHVGEQPDKDEPAPGRVLIVTNSTASPHPLEDAVKDVTHIDVLKAVGESNAVSCLVQGIRSAQPIDLVSIDANIAMGDDGDNMFPDLCAKAAAAGIPVCLYGTTTTETPDIQILGYCGRMIAPDVSVVQRALTQARDRDANTGENDQRVVRVEPWAWTNRKKSVNTSKILVVDDNRTNLLIVESILAGAGYQVDSMTNSEQALEKLLDTPYQLAVLDIHMPGSIDGVTMLKRYRLLRGVLKIPIVFLTASTNMETTRACAEAGADAYLTKPVRKESLLATVATLIRERELQGTESPGDEDASPAKPPLINTAVLKQVADPNSPLMTEIVSAFESEGATLLRKLTSAATDTHAAYIDVAHALKAMAITVGAEALVTACRDAESMSVMEFQNRGARRAHELDGLFRDTVSAIKSRLKRL